jgi:hypothetical protein
MSLTSYRAAPSRVTAKPVRFGALSFGCIAFGSGSDL